MSLMNNQANNTNTTKKAVAESLPGGGMLLSSSNPVEEDTALLKETFKPLKMAGAEFGYRTITEIRQLATQLNQFDIEVKKERLESPNFKKEEVIFDIAILQKLLPKLYGSVGKLKVPLTVLAELCFDEGKWEGKYLNTENDEWELSKDLRYPLSFEKIKSMYAYATRLNGDDSTKLAIRSALTLYLDFINLFIMLLQFFGNRR